MNSGAIASNRYISSRRAKVRQASESRTRAFGAGGLPESTVCPWREMAVKYISSPEISPAMKARSVSNPFAVRPEPRSMLPARSLPPDPTTKYTMPFCGFTRS